MASTYSERLAMGPLRPGDVERVVAVLLRGLMRQSGRVAPGGDETARTTAAPSADLRHPDSAPPGGVNDAEGSNGV
jgi:hypothetical protein